MTTKQELGSAIALLRAEFPEMQAVEGPRLEIWWKALCNFPDGSVMAAAERHIMTSKFKPQLADLREACELQTNGQWLGADEAWGMMPKSEYDSAMLTNEIAEAIAAATPLLVQGDKVAARMAFKDCYTRLVERAKLEGRQPVYFPSFGTDSHGRVQMLANAVQKGQLQIDRAIGYMPEQATSLLGMCNVKSHPLLAGPSAAGKAAVANLLADLRATK